MKLRKNLDHSACALVRAGHANVFGYPWDLFLAASEELADAMKALKGK